VTDKPRAQTVSALGHDRHELGARILRLLGDRRDVARLTGTTSTPCSLAAARKTKRATSGTPPIALISGTTTAIRRFVDTEAFPS
jgi:hypothetical protein